MSAKTTRLRGRLRIAESRIAKIRRFSAQRITATLVKAIRCHRGYSLTGLAKDELDMIDSLLKIKGHQ